MPAVPSTLGRLLVAFGCDAEAVDVSPRFRLPLWANGLGVLDGGEVPQRELPTRVRLSRRALASTLTTLARRGWVAKRGEARRKVLHLTDEGSAVAAAWRPVPGTVESNWRSGLGAGRVDRLRAALADLVGRLPLGGRLVVSGPGGLHQLWLQLRWGLTRR